MDDRHQHGGDGGGSTAVPPLPPELDALIDVIRATPAPIPATLATGHIAAAAAAAQAALPPYPMTPMTVGASEDALIDLALVASEGSAVVASAAPGHRTRAERRRRVAFVAVPIAVLAASTLAAAALTLSKTPDLDMSHSATTMAAGRPDGASPPTADGPTAPDLDHGGTSTTVDPSTEAPVDQGDGSSGPVGPGGTPTGTNTGSVNAGHPAPPNTSATPSSVGGPGRPAPSTTTASSTPSTPSPTTTVAAPHPPAGSGRLVTLGGTTCTTGIRLATPGSSLTVAGTVDDNCDAQLDPGTSLASPALVLAGVMRNSGTVFGAVFEHQPTTVDPFVGLPAPSGGVNRAGGDFTATTVLQPGRYTDPITIGVGGDVTLAPGVYDVPGLTITAGARVSGSGVVIHVRAGALHVDDCTSVSLSAPNTGAYAGFVVVQPATNTNDLDLRRGSSCSWSVRGNVYAPMARLGVQGDIGLTASRVVVGSLIDLGLAHVSISN